VINDHLLIEEERDNGRRENIERKINRGMIEGRANWLITEGRENGNDKKR
jgi:hypothetical protein